MSYYTKVALAIIIFAIIALPTPTTLNVLIIGILCHLISCFLPIVCKVEANYIITWEGGWCSTIVWGKGQHSERSLPCHMISHLHD